MKDRKKLLMMGTVGALGAHYKLTVMISQALRLTFYNMSHTHCGFTVRYHNSFVASGIFLSLQLICDIPQAACLLSLFEM